MTADVCTAADEMGLGKVRILTAHIPRNDAYNQTEQTLQTIAFSAYLRQTGHSKPFLVVCPLSVLHNWIEEYEKFAPEVHIPFSSCIRVRVDATLALMHFGIGVC
jgi:SNF2 family DNA or RNA helicase